jgi:4-hydroxy 2-oxovalerate aldolase
MVKLLDCTIRDGGYINNWNFTDEQVRECYKACDSAGVDYMEIGFRNRQNNSTKYGATYYCTEEYLTRILKDIDLGCKLAVMVTINEFNIDDFCNKQDSDIHLVRVLMAYHGGKNVSDDVLDIKQLLDGIHQSNLLIEKGYDVSFNVGRIDKVSKEQLYRICEEIAKTDIKYFCIADTYGSVDSKFIKDTLPYIKSLFVDTFKNTNIEIGFHAHDNFGNATTKALTATEHGAAIIDGCSLGFGRGSGNAKTELLMIELNKFHDKQYDFKHIMNFGNEYLINYKECTNNLCYNIVYVLSAYFGVHVSYAIDIIEKRDPMTVYAIYNFFSMLKNTNKHMFYHQNIMQSIKQ